MKLEVMIEWVAALRSSKYKQTKRALQNGDAYCCLGVLCELAPHANFNASCGELYGANLGDQRAVKEWSEFKTDNGLFASHLNSLEVLNDAGKTFEEIADIIEANWEKL